MLPLRAFAVNVLTANEVIRDAALSGSLPDLAWSIERAPGGGDPIEMAWKLADQPLYMLALVRLAFGPSQRDGVAETSRWTAMKCDMCFETLWSDDENHGYVDRLVRSPRDWRTRCLPCANAIRRVISVTMEDVVKTRHAIV